MHGAETRAVEAHWTREDLETTILAGIRAAGLNPERLTPEDLAPVDALHIRGREPTEELAELAGLEAGQRVLDVGCGLGGTARYLASRHGVEATGVDLTAAYCRVGEMLNKRTGLADRVELAVADALELPFADGTFDHVWTEHITMNIADKQRLFGELRRVLRGGGRLAFYEVVAGPRAGLHFPVPWAYGPEIDFIVSADGLRAPVESSGFTVLAWRDVSSLGLEWFRQQAGALAAGKPPALGLHLVLGPDTRQMFVNQVRNLEEDRIRLIQAVADAA